VTSLNDVIQLRSFQDPFSKIWLSLYLDPPPPRFIQIDAPGRHCW